MSSKPDFLGIGAVKSGTTWLHHNLGAHPRVWMPPVKELRYFDEPEWNLAERFLGPWTGGDPKRYEHWRRELRHFVRTPSRWLGPRRLTWHLRYFLGRRGPSWYADLFRPGRRQVAGEISPFYALLVPEDVAFVHRNFPRLRILYLLRDPIDRTWSHVLLRCLSLADWRWQGVTPSLASETFFTRDVHDERLWRNNDYAANLARWEARFGRERIGVFFYPDLEEDPTKLLARIERFLGVDPEAHPPSQALRRRRHATPRRLPLPPEIEAEIARRIVPDLTRLAERFAGEHDAPRRWLERARGFAV